MEWEAWAAEWEVCKECRVNQALCLRIHLLELPTQVPNNQTPSPLWAEWEASVAEEWAVWEETQ